MEKIDFYSLIKYSNICQRTFVCKDNPFHIKKQYENRRTDINKRLYYIAKHLGIGKFSFNTARHSWLTFAENQNDPVANSGNGESQQPQDHANLFG